MEIAPLKAANASLPVTTNFMEYFYDYDYWQLAEALDFISWDSYPMWHRDKDETALACYTAMYHDMMRSLKGGKPFVLMESTPGATNWQPTSKIRCRECMVAATGGGAWRRLRSISSGGKAAVRLRNFTAQWSTTSDILIPRIGREVCQLGEILSKLPEVRGCRTEAKVAIIFDQQNRWALDDAQGRAILGWNMRRRSTSTTARSGSRASPSM